MKYLLLLATSLSVAAPAFAQDDEPESKEIILYERVRDTYITVVGTGRNQSISETGQSISVIGANEIASIQGPDLTRVLERLPG